MSYADRERQALVELALAVYSDEAATDDDRRLAAARLEQPVADLKHLSVDELGVHLWLLEKLHGLPAGSRAHEAQVRGCLCRLLDELGPDPAWAQVASPDETETSDDLVS